MHFRLELVEYIGKKNKNVPTLLTAEVVCALNALVKHRTKCGIKEENQYLFANQGIGPIPSLTTLSQCAMETQCQSPELISSSRVQKFIATVVQVGRITI